MKIKFILFYCAIVVLQGYSDVISLAPSIELVLKKYCHLSEIIVLGKYIQLENEKDSVYAYFLPTDTSKNFCCSVLLVKNVIKGDIDTECLKIFPANINYSRTEFSFDTLKQLEPQLKNNDSYIFFLRKDQRASKEQKKDIWLFDMVTKVGIKDLVEAECHNQKK